MTDRRHWTVGLVALALCATFTACGGDEGSTATSPRAANETQTETTGRPGNGKPRADAASPRSIEKELPPEAQVDLSIKGVLASAAPDLACRRYATARYVKETFGDRGGCVQSTVPASAADSVKVTKIEISGDAASAKAVPSGGPSDGETIKVELVRQGGIWKVKSLHSNAPVGP
jgi:hypothetical protein